MKKILFIISLFVSFVSFGQVYQLMPQYGYQANRMNFDSTLQIPTTCGVPTLRTVVNVKRAAIAFDSCNNRFYQYNPKTSSWSVISGVDTTSLSNRINTKIDSLKRSRDSVFAKVNGVWRFQYKDSIGGSTPSLQAVTDVGATTDKSITIGIGGEQGLLNLNTWNNDSYRNKFIDYNGQQELFGGGYFQVIDSFSKNMSIQFGNTNGFSETSNYIGQKSNLYYQNIPTIELNGINNRILITPDEQVFRSSASNSLTLITDFFGTDDTLNYPKNNGIKDTIATLADVSQKLNISDTTNKWVTSVTKLNDSTIRVVKNTTTTDITLTPAATVTAATRLVTSVYNNSGSTITKGSVVYINGRHSSNLPTIALAQANTEANSYATFALVQDNITNGNSGIAIQAGNIGNLNLPTSSYTDGEVIYLSPTVAGGLTTNKTSVLAPNHIVKIGTITRAHPTLGSIEIKIENGWQLDELSDVKIAVVPNDSTLFQFSRVDSLWHDVSVTNAIGNKYLKPTDTASMLTPYLRKVDTTNRFVNNITRTAGKDSIIFFIGGTRYAIKDSVGGGGGSAAGSTGNIQYNNGGAFAGSNNLFWDNTNSRLGIGTTSPLYSFDINSGRARVAGNNGIVGAIGGTNYGLSVQNNAAASWIEILNNGGANKGAFFGINSNNFEMWNYQGGAIDFYTDVTATSGLNRMRINNNGNILVGTTTDAGYKLDVNGTTRLNGNTTLGSTGFWDNTNSRLGIGTTSPSNRFHLTGSITASSGLALSSLINPTLVAAANSDKLVGLDINPTFTNGAFTNVWNVPLRVSNDVIIGTDVTTLNSASFVNEKVFIGRNGSGTSNGYLGLLANVLAAPTSGISTGALIGFNGSTTNFYGQGLSDARNSKFDIWFQTGAVNGGGYRFYTGTQENVTIFDNGNMLLQAGGSKTNAGFRLDVNGTARATQFQLSALNTAPATASSTGTTGEIRIVNGFIYICVATNTWQRAALSTW